MVVVGVGFDGLHQCEDVLRVKDARALRDGDAADVETRRRRVEVDAVLVEVDRDAARHRAQRVFELYQLDGARVAEREVEKDREHLLLEEARVEAVRGEHRAHEAASSHPLLEVFGEDLARNGGHVASRSANVISRSAWMKYAWRQ